jgi:hypothetical protein
MTVRTLDGKSLCEQLAENYKRTLPQTYNKSGTAWTMDSFSTWVSLRYPHVKVVEGQEWGVIGDTYQMVCEYHGNFSAQAHNLVTKGSGCQCNKCGRERNASLAGTRRAKRGTKEDKEKAAELYAELGNYSEVGRILGFSDRTICRWLVPEARDLARLNSRRWVRENPEKRKSNSKRYDTYSHGKENKRKGWNRRRGLNHNSIFDVLVDGQLVKVNMRSPEWYKDLHGKNLISTNEDFQIFVDEESTKVYAQMVQQCKEMEDYFGFPFEVDHLIPLAAGGEHIKENFEIKPASENRSKGDERNVDDDIQFCKNLFNIK